MLTRRAKRDHRVVITREIDRKLKQEIVAPVVENILANAQKNAPTYSQQNNNINPTNQIRNTANTIATGYQPRVPNHDSDAGPTLHSELAANPVIMNRGHLSVGVNLNGSSTSLNIASGAASPSIKNVIRDPIGPDSITSKGFRTRTPGNLTPNAMHGSSQNLSQVRSNHHHNNNNNGPHHNNNNHNLQSSSSNNLTSPNSRANNIYTNRSSGYNTPSIDNRLLSGNHRRNQNFGSSQSMNESLSVKD